MELSETVKLEIRHWALHKGQGSHRRTCPECSSDRKQHSLECLSVTVDATKAVFKCWHCPLEGAVRLSSREILQPYNPPAPMKKTTKAVKEVGKALDAKAKAFLLGRGISADTANLFGVTWATAYFMTMKREGHGIAFPYMVDGKLVGHKVRASDEKDHVCLPALYSLFGLQNVDMVESQDFILAEGELDCLSFYEAGILNATSVPNGASSFARTEDPKDPRAHYGFLWSAKPLIDKAKRILIATDNDEPGEKIAEELARRMGKHRCWRVLYPEGCKDANDVLMRLGRDALAECAANAKPWPIDGLYEASVFYEDVYDLYENGYEEKVSTGYANVDEIYSVNPGLLTIITGLPAQGKTTFVDQLMVNLARKENYSFGICSFENPPKVHIAKLSEMLLQKHFFPSETVGQKMTREELESVQPFITEHFKFLQQDDGKKANLESILERIRTAVFRWGIRGAVIDPYNYIERPKSAESETQWIDDMLTQVRMVAMQYGLHIWFVAHSTKLSMDSDGKYPPPRGYSISGSSSWYSKADFGITVHRGDMPGIVRIINWKTRYDWFGQEGERIVLYDNAKNVYLADLHSDLGDSYDEATHGQ